MAMWGLFSLMILSLQQLEWRRVSGDYNAEFYVPNFKSALLGSSICNATGHWRGPWSSQSNGLKPLTLRFSNANISAQIDYQPSSTASGAMGGSGGGWRSIPLFIGTTAVVTKCNSTL